MSKRSLWVAVAVLGAVVLAALWWRGSSRSTVAVTPKPPTTQPSKAPVSAPAAKSTVVATPQPAKPSSAAPTTNSAPAIAPSAQPTVPTLASVPTTPPTAPATTAPATVTPATPPIPAQTLSFSRPANEVEATQRMIQAHAPLRDPRIADPNSPENRQILETMVMKAIAQAKK